MIGNMSVTKETFPHLAATVLAIDELAPNIKQYTLARADGEPYPFVPGQHLLVWGAEKYTTYSIGSSPNAPETFQFSVRRTGAGTIYLLDTVRVGDTVTVTPPMGKGFSQELLAGKSLWFIAGGIGLMGLSAQILALEESTERAHGEHKLFYGLKDRQELLWPDRLERWRAFMDIDVTGDGRHLVGDLLHEGLDGHAEVAALICGPAAFFRPVLEALLKVGVPPRQILNNIWE